MIELTDDGLAFSFPGVHPDARFTVGFQRTLRIPDDDRDHALPPGLGRFPLRHVDDHRDRAPAAWRRHGGVMLPTYPSEALWVNFSSPDGYPFAVKVATGKINAVTGEAWDDGLHRRAAAHRAAHRAPHGEGNHGPGAPLVRLLRRRPGRGPGRGTRGERAAAMF